MSVKKVLKANNNAELLSYIINVNPILREEIDLPRQGESIIPIGKLIMNNSRYRNAFINTVNIIGLTVIKRNAWENPWDFTNKGLLRRGQQIREIILDLCKSYDYNEQFNNKTLFLQTEVPNIFNYIHSINFQKFWHTTTSDEQFAMAFENDDGLFDFIENSISMLYESKIYAEYVVNKYQLCRRIVDGTITSVEITDYAIKTPRERVSDMKSISNKMTFRSPNYNPAGVRRATNFSEQIFILNTDFEAEMSTEVLATSYFRDDAEFKSNARLIDGFAEHDNAYLKELLGEAFIPFTEEELAELRKVPAVIISKDFFMNYYYALGDESGTKSTEFYNPTTFENNHFLHCWEVFSTSPFANAVVFVEDIQPSITSVTVSPSESSLSAGLTLQLTASVVTTGFANKSVIWSVTKGGQEGKATIDNNGLLKVASDYNTSESVSPQIEITATSVYDNTKTGKATITVL